MDEKQVVELEGGAIPHELSACEDDGIVGDEEGKNGLEGQEGRHAWRDVQRISGIAFGSCPHSVENLPWREVAQSDGLNVVGGLWPAERHD